MCQCECGNTVSVHQQALVSKNGTRSCGCITAEQCRVLTRPRMDLTGQRFGRLTALERVDDYTIPTGHSYGVWKCQCDCGNIKEVKQGKLIQGRTRSCGCYRIENSSKIHRIDLTIGQTFGILKIKSGPYRTERYNGRQLIWECECECGNIVYYTTHSLLVGDAKSCGCLISMGEKQIREYLLKNNISFQKQYWFDDLRNDDTNAPLYFDFGILNDDNSLRCLIEYNGEQHYRDCGDFGKLQREKTDQMKVDYCMKNQIPLFIIKYDEDLYDKLELIVA